ncbi:MAG TPA: M56 family metallopeptidase [Blastocatellia bacterium]|nr:M56 family metallopeptidase [Blastocatellia bacterium]
MERISQALLTCLLNACWQIALITSVAALCAWLLRETAARYRHLLWVAALALCFCLPVLTTYQVSRGAFIMVQPEPQTAVQETFLSSTQIPLDISTSPKETSSLVPVSRNLATGLVAIYLLFLGYRAVSLFKAWRLTRAIGRSVSRIELPEHLRTIIERCQTALGVKRVGIFCSAAVPMPITVGGLNPLVILPEQLLLEVDPDVLTSAIGHELVHVRRRDYALNLMYELIHLPLSFHPAAALVRRRIRETRELSCDELVADRLLKADVYARSLVRLAGSAIAVGRQTTITVGITDADILEERVMSILRPPKIKTLRKNLLLVAASLLLAVPCVAAVPFALRININRLDAGVTPQQGASQETQLKEERGRSEVVMPALEADANAGTLVAWLKKPGETVRRGDVIARVDTSKGVVEVPATTSGVIERLLVAVGEKASAGSVLAVIRGEGWVGSSEASTAQQLELERQALLKALEARVQDLRLATTQDAAQKVKQQAELEQALLALAAQQRTDGARAVTTTNGTVTLTKTLRAVSEQQEGEEKVLHLRALQALEQNLELARAQQESHDPEILVRQRAERELIARQQAELAKQANITMQQAIQIATNQYPGTVLESRLVRESNQACYVLTILYDNGTETTRTRVLMSAIDGSIIKTMKEER